MRKGNGGKSFRALHKSQASRRSKSSNRIFDEFRKDFFFLGEIPEYANDNTTKPYEEGK